MDRSSEIGRYRIHAVEEQTGVPAATLRAWERRYGFPAPGRTSSAYRLYSDRDVAQVRRMQELLESGLSAAEAARQVRQEPPAPVQLPSDPYLPAVQALLAATEAFDPRALEGAIRQALNLGPASIAWSRIFSPAMRSIGDRWHEGTLSVAHEHFATQAIEGAIRGVLGLVQPADASRSALLGCFPEETHVLGLYGAAFALAGWGYRTFLLGPRTPPAAVALAVDRLSPSLVGLSAVVTPASAEAVVEGYAAACKGTPWIVGGDAAAELAPLVEARGGICVIGAASNARLQLEQAVARTERMAR